MLLITHFSLKRQLLRMRSHECLYFYLKHSQSNIFLTFLIVYGTLTKCVERVISNWTVLEVKTQERRSLEQTKHRLILTFQWKLNKQRCNCERMRDKDVKFIHIISIVTVVYNNGINLKILMSHLTTTFKFPHVWFHLPMSEFTNNSLQISASLHQLDLAPYVSGSYNAQWNAPKLLHGKHMLCSSRILRKRRLRNLGWGYGYHWIIE